MIYGSRKDNVRECDTPKRQRIGKTDIYEIKEEYTQVFIHWTMKMDRLKTITYDYCCQSWDELEARALASKPGQRRLNYTARISIDAVAYDCWGFLK